MVKLCCINHNYLPTSGFCQAGPETYARRQGVLCRNGRIGYNRCVEEDLAIHRPCCGFDGEGEQISGDGG
jgi:hypothetical protein